MKSVQKYATKNVKKCDTIGLEITYLLQLVGHIYYEIVFFPSVLRTVLENSSTYCPSFALLFCIFDILTTVKV